MLQSKTLICVSRVARLLDDILMMFTLCMVTLTTVQQINLKSQGLNTIEVYFSVISCVFVISGWHLSKQWLSFLSSLGFGIFKTRIPHYRERGEGTEDCMCFRAKLRSGTRHLWLPFPWPEFGHMLGNWDWSPAVCPKGRGHSYGPCLACLCPNCFLSTFTPSACLCNLSFLLLLCRAWQCSQDVEDLRKHLKIQSPVKFYGF